MRAVLLLLAPREVYAQVAAGVPARGMLVLGTALMSIALGVYVATDMGRSAIAIAASRAMDGIGLGPGTWTHGQIQDMLVQQPWGLAALPWVALPAFTAAVARLLRRLGPPGRNGVPLPAQTLMGVVAHANLLLAIGVGFNVALGLTRGEPALVRLPTLLLAWLPAVPAAVAGAVDPFILWWVANLSTGLSVLYGVPARSAAARLTAVYLGGLVLWVLADAQ